MKKILLSILLGLITLPFVASAININIPWVRFNSSGEKPVFTTDQILIGASATTTLSMLEVSGTSSLLGKVQVAQPVNSALIIGDITGNTRGLTAIDIQSERLDLSYVASGDYCTIVGLDSTCLANFGGTFGYSNYSGDINAYAIGSSNHSNGTYSQTFGRANTADAFDIAIGNTNSASGGNYAAAFGAINVSAGIDTLTVGHSNQALYDAALAIGVNNTSNAYGGGIYGYSNTINASANGAFVIGGGLTATLASSTYIGQLASSSLTISGQTGSLSAQYFVSTSTTATSTGANGWNLTKGCFAINSVCVGSGTLTGAGNNLGVAYWDSVSSLADSKNLQWQNSTGRFAVGASSTPFGQVSITTTAGTSSLVIGSTTGTHLILDSTGNLGIGTSTPAGIVSINHTAGNNALMIGSSTNTSFAIDAYGHPVFGGTAPTLSSCGASPRFYFGDDSGGIILGGTGSQTSCTLTFSAQSNLTTMAPSCTVTMATSTAHTLSASTTPTTLVITSNRTLAAMATQYNCSWHMK